VGRLATLKPRVQTLRTMTAKPLQAVERKRGSAGVKDRNTVRQRDNGLCQACLAEGRVSIGVDVDHKTPLWAGGLDTEENKWLLCSPCHLEKSTREAKQRAAGSGLPG
jgi:5-methylcytosine-specific restriction protein A